MKITFYFLKCYLQISRQQVNYLKKTNYFSKLTRRKLVFPSFRNYKHKYENITENEFNALLEHRNLKNIIIQKSEKGNSVVLINKEIYKGKIKSILNGKQN